LYYVYIMVTALKKIELVLFLSPLLLYSSRYILAKEYPINVSVGSQVSIKEKKVFYT